MDWLIGNEKDPAKRDALINDLMTVYDKRVKYFGDDSKYGKDWIISRKAQDYLRLKGDNADEKLVYDWLKEVIDEKGNDMEALGVSLFMFASLKEMQNDPNLKGRYIQDYLKCSAILDAQIKAAEAANNEKDLKALTSFKTPIESAFAGSGAADCETLQNMYAPKVEAAKDNLSELKSIMALLRRVRCQDIEAFFAAGGYAYKLEPSADAAVGIAKQAAKNNDYDKAMQYFEEAANLETDAASKAEDYYFIAVICYEQKNLTKSRQYCLKAIETNPNYGAPYSLIGSMYVQSAKSIYPNDPVLTKAVYYAAIDKFEKAKQVDPSMTEEMNKSINIYRAYLPTAEEIFMHPDLEKGKTFKIGGWIGETVTIK